MISHFFTRPLLRILEFFNGVRPPLRFSYERGESMPDQFSRTRLLLGAEAVRTLQQARVIVFGVGGVGGFAVEALARAGVGTIDLVDNDTVCLTNINRQIIATHQSVGRYKTEVMAERIHDINPDCVVHRHECFFLPETSAEFHFEEYDYVIDAVDTVTAKIQLVMACQAAGTPIISSMGAGNKLDPTKFQVADIYQTSIDPLARVMRRELKKRQVKHLKVVYSTEEALTPMADAGNVSDETVSSDVEHFSKRRSTPGSVAFVPSVAGLIIGGEVIKDLTKEAMKKNFRRL